MDGLLGVEEVHARADVSDDPPGLLLGERLLGGLEQGAEITADEQLHHKNQAVRPGRDGPVYVHRVRAAEAGH